MTDEMQLKPIITPVNRAFRRKYTWKRSLPDFRNLKFKDKLIELAPIRTVYLANDYNIPPCYDQLDVGSCVGNGTAFVVHFDLVNKHAQHIISPWRPSRLYIYYYGRTVYEQVAATDDSGMQVNSAFKVLNRFGVCSEDAWIYGDYESGRYTLQPTPYAQRLASAVTAVNYYQVDDPSYSPAMFKQVLVNVLLKGYPVVFGMTVYSSFESAVNGIIPMPGASESVLGGHCMVIVGYDTRWDAFIVRNSWGPEWGQDGYCRIPAAYLCNQNLAADFWACEVVL